MAVPNVRSCLCAWAFWHIRWPVWNAATICLSVLRVPSDRCQKYTFFFFFANLMVCPMSTQWVLMATRFSGLDPKSRFYISRPPTSTVADVFSAKRPVNRENEPKQIFFRPNEFSHLSSGGLPLGITAALIWVSTSARVSARQTSWNQNPNICQ